MRMAAKAALKSSYKQHRVGAVIVKGGNILATGFNSKQPSAVLHTATRHAEAAAILSLIKQHRLHDLCGADIYVTRFTRGGVSAMARPCSVCYALIRSGGIRRIFYTDTTGSTTMEKVI